MIENLVVGCLTMAFCLVDPVCDRRTLASFGVSRQKTALVQAHVLDEFRHSDRDHARDAAGQSPADIVVGSAVSSCSANLATTIRPSITPPSISQHSGTAIWS